MAPNYSDSMPCRFFRQGQYDVQHGYHMRSNLPAYIAGRQSEVPWMQPGDIYGECPFHPNFSLPPLLCNSPIVIIPLSPTTSGKGNPEPS